jgi:hypothetical protein
MNDYRINGKGVGHNPDSFVRSKNYEDFFARTSSGAEHVHRVKNFISAEDRQSLIDLVNSTPADETPGQWSGMIWRTPESDSIIQPYTTKVLNLFRATFGIGCKFVGGSYVVQWGQSKKMDLHVDDLGSGENQLSAVIYLNDDYEGGNINFPTHNLSISPEAGELIFFPGNLNYAHEVEEITSGARITLPIWAEIL